MSTPDQAAGGLDLDSLDLDAIDLHAVLGEIKQRTSDALSAYRPIPFQERFHGSAATERIIRGGNRSGKSTSAALEFAAVARRRTLFVNGEYRLPPILDRFPEDEPLLLWVVGYSEEYLGATIYRLLFEPGLFDVIEDPQTGEVRAFNPETDDPSLKQPSAPLIPESEIDPKGWAFHSKAARTFKQCRLKNGTVIRAWSSKQEPKQGDPVHFAWIDEDLVRMHWVPELQARLSDRKGGLIWSAFPRSNCDALLTMSERAEEQQGRENPDVEEFVLRFRDNPFIDPDEKRKRLEAWEKSGDHVSRDLGEFALGNRQMFPEFRIDKHGVNWENPSDRLEHAIARNSGRVPPDWTWYLVVDPGYARPAALVAAVPPPTVGDFIVVCGEVKLTDADARRLAREVKAVVTGQPLHEMIIDCSAGRQHGLGRSDLNEEHYANALAEVGIRNSRGNSRLV